MACAASFLLIGLTALGVTRFDWLETLAFVTGGICVWLTVRQHIWNWPIGIANSLIFAIVFWQSRLFADMTLQWVYVALGFFGWYHWLRGGQSGGPLEARRAPFWLMILVLASVGAGTLFMEWHLTRVHDAAPLWDALTTCLSLAAQYLLTRKFLENWALWILADLIYIPLYWSRGLMLTSVLYMVFLALCVAGMRQWQRSLVQ